MPKNGGLYPTDKIILSATPFKTVVNHEGKTYDGLIDWVGLMSLKGTMILLVGSSHKQYLVTCAFHTLPSERDSSLKLEQTADRARAGPYEGNIIAFVMHTVQTSS